MSVNKIPTNKQKTKFACDSKKVRGIHGFNSRRSSLSQPIFSRVFLSTSSSLAVTFWGLEVNSNPVAFLPKISLNGIPKANTNLIRVSIKYLEVMKMKGNSIELTLQLPEYMVNELYK